MASALNSLYDRHQMIRYFDGFLSERMEELSQRNLKKPLLKTHLLELLRGDHQVDDQELKNIFKRSGIGLRQFDEGLYAVSDIENNEIGFLEHLSNRIVAFYSTLKTKQLDGIVRRMVYPNPQIDNVWLSGLTFNVLWKLVVKLSDPNRYIKLSFEHDSIFEIDKYPEDHEEDEQAAAEEKEPKPIENEEEEQERIWERRKTGVRLWDRVGVIDGKLKTLQQDYLPLHAISQLRFPSQVGRGGHDFYDNGKVTNRSESFRDHRNFLVYVVRIYDNLLKSTESRTWYSIKESVGAPTQFRKIVGAPVVIKFREPLRQDVFKHWISATFFNKRNRFRLWGTPIPLGKNKVHVYGLDRHLWQPIFLELTDKGCIAIVPNGTCGNTIHRLVTNIQRYLDPGAEAFIGDIPYSDIVKEAANNVSLDKTDD